MFANSPAREPPERADGELVGGSGRRGRLADHARRDLHVLLAQRRDDVARGHAELRDPVGIEPHAHAVVAAPEDGDVAHAIDAREHVAT
jgi:hypothetical protein